MNDPNERILRFLDHVSSTCEHYGVLLNFVDKQYLTSDDRTLHSAGVFISHFAPDEKERAVRGVLNIAMRSRSPGWLPVLVHESSHMMQWAEQSSVWINNSAAPFQFYEMLEGRVIGSRIKLTQLCRRAQELELDCEKRAVAEIRKWKLPIDVKKYIKHANDMLWWFSLLLEFGPNHLGNNERNRGYGTNIFPKLPISFQDNYDVVPDYIRSIYIKKPK